MGCCHRCDGGIGQNGATLVATFPHPLYSKATVIGPLQIEDRDALAVEGVTDVVPLEHGVAVVGTDYWATVKGKRALKVAWQRGAASERYDSDAVLDEFAAIARNPARQGVTRGNSGDVAAAFSEPRAPWLENLPASTSTTQPWSR